MNFIKLKKNWGFNKMVERETVGNCGCVWIELSDNNGNSCCFLKECRCKHHYSEQLVAEWYDNEGYHREVREPEDVPGLVPLVLGCMSLEDNKCSGDGKLCHVKYRVEVRKR